MTFRKRLDEFAALMKETVSTMKTGEEISVDKALFESYRFIEATKEKKGKVYVIGNGGSAGIASHFSVDLIKTLEVPAITLFDSNVVTCISNDYGYEHVFSAPLKILLKKEDLLVAISSSGKSPNIINAAMMAKNLQARVITLSGFSSLNPLRKIGDLNFFLERFDYGLVEMGHFFLLHTFVDLWKSGSFSAFEKISEDLISTHAE